MARPPEGLDRTLLILDLDETLIHASERPLAHRAADFELFGYHVHCRPHLTAFLAEVTRHYALAVWSSASDDYVQGVTERIFPNPSALQFVWGRSRATWRRLGFTDDPYLHWPNDHRHYLKPLSKLRRRGWQLTRMLIVDDTPEKCVRNYGNAIYVQPFEGEAEDEELLLLAAYLAEMKDCPNVRSIEKRKWRARALTLLGRESEE